MCLCVIVYVNACTHIFMCACSHTTVNTCLYVHTQRTYYNKYTRNRHPPSHLCANDINIYYHGRGKSDVNEKLQISRSLSSSLEIERLRSNVRTAGKNVRSILFYLFFIHYFSCFHSLIILYIYYDIYYFSVFLGMVVIGDEILNGFTAETNMAVAAKSLSKKSH